ncbi:MAG: PLP-dependent cysteine synthase family protein [Planctomycetes bacterium]|nr:PLP-dependent cysteine synthase family protein [Planctomycetota bacterium]
MPDAAKILAKLAELTKTVPLLGIIGNTPLLRIEPFEPVAKGAQILAKAEFRNPGGSIKDRSVLFMILDALVSGKLGKRRILDSSSGNAGIAYAMLGAALDLPVTLVCPGNASNERRKRITAHGAELILTDALLGYDEAHRRAHKLGREQADKYCLIDQYNNAANPLAHYTTTGREIIEQCPHVTHLVTGVGTGGTLSGVARRLKGHNPKVKVVQIMPDEFPGIEGLKALDDPKVVRPGNFDEKLVDERVHVEVGEAYTYCRKLARRGLFVGQSSGAYLAVAHVIARREADAKIVTLLCDTGERYFSAQLWDA